jgi:di/tricarboxylate transporter
MSKVSIGVFCGAVAYLALVFGLACLVWGEAIHSKAFAVMIVAFACAVACVDWKKVPE